MPNAVKYKTGNLTGSLQKGNVALGISGSLGPTSTTGWYNGPNPVAGKYQIFETAISGDPDVYSPQDDAELIRFARWKGATGADTGSVAAVLAWIGTQTNLMAANFEYPTIVTDGLVLNLDAGFVGSYPTTGTTIYDISGNNNNGTLINGTSFNTTNGGALVFDGVDDRLTFGSPNMTSSCTVNQWIQPLSGSANTMRTVEHVAVNTATAVLYSQLVKISNIWYHQVLVSGYQSGYAEEMNVYFQSNVTSFVQNNTPYNFNFTWERTSGVDSTLKTYLNGVFREQQINTNNYWANTASLATSTYTVGSSYKGNIGTTSFYNRALTETEITQNYNAQKGRFGL
jgi:hypothetical protein